MHNIELKCDKFLNVNKNEAEYELSNFSFKDVKIETKFSQWNKDAFHNIRMKNVIVNGQYQQLFKFKDLFLIVYKITIRKRSLNFSPFQITYLHSLIKNQ